MAVSVQLTPGTVVINRYRTSRLNKIFGSYFLVFGRCGVTPHRLYRGSLTLTSMKIRNIYWMILIAFIKYVLKYWIDTLLKRKKYVQGNNKPFLNKTLSQVIMQRIKLRDKFLKDPTEHNKISYTKLVCVALEKGKEGIFCQS